MCTVSWQVFNLKISFAFYCELDERAYISFTCIAVITKYTFGEFIKLADHYCTFLIIYEPAASLWPFNKIYFSDTITAAKTRLYYMFFKLIFLVWRRPCDLIKRSRTATKWTLRWDCRELLCPRSRLNLRPSFNNNMDEKRSETKKKIKFQLLDMTTGQIPSADEDHAIWQKAPEQLLVLTAILQWSYVFLQEYNRLF